MSKDKLLSFFDTHNLTYTLHEHKPVFTVEQSEHLHDEIPGAHSKNLFLQDRKETYFLVSILHHKRLDIKALSKLLDVKGLSFANEEKLLQLLQLTPGAVTPFGLFHPSARNVRFILDEDFLQSDFVNFHPLQNNATVSMKLDSFLKFFDLIGHPLVQSKIPERMQACTS